MTVRFSADLSYDSKRAMAYHHLLEIDSSIAHSTYQSSPTLRTCPPP